MRRRSQPNPQKLEIYGNMFLKCKIQDLLPCKIRAKIFPISLREIYGNVVLPAFFHLEKYVKPLKALKQRRCSGGNFWKFCVDNLYGKISYISVYKNIKYRLTIDIKPFFGIHILKKCPKIKPLFRLCQKFGRSYSFLCINKHLLY